MNGNLLYIVARHNVERIYGNGRFDFIDDDLVQAVLDVAAELPDPRRRRDHRPAPKSEDLRRQIQEWRPSA
jgi:hypothetical protein